MNVMKIVETTKLFKNHGKGIGYWRVELVELSGGEAGGIISHAKGEGCKEVTASFMSKPKNVGKANETSALDQARSEVQSRINKQLDKGYVRTEEEATAPATNASGRKMPMLAEKIQDVKEEDIDWQNAFSQPKLDGHRCLNDKGQYSRQGNDINLPHIAAELERLGLHNLPLDGELYCHGKSLQEIGSLVKKPREESLQIEYHLYDLVLDIPFEQRHMMLCAAFGAQPLHPEFQGDTCVKLVPTSTIANMDQRKLANKKWVGLGYEGDMLRHGTDGYADGKRSKQLLKGKLRDDHEFKVVGYEEAKPKVTRDDDGNVVRTLRAPIWVLDVGDGRTFKALAHGTIQVKNEQWEDRESKIGQLLKVSHFGYTPDGIPREPIAEAWHDPL